MCMCVCDGTLLCAGVSGLCLVSCVSLAHFAQVDPLPPGLLLVVAPLEPLARSVIIQIHNHFSYDLQRHAHILSIT